jgi:hypothetical protein
MVRLDRSTNMAKREISAHEVRFFRALEAAGTTWTTSQDLAAVADISPRTARAYALRLARERILEARLVFPAHHYRLSPKAAAAYTQAIETAAEVWGL